MKKDGVSPMKYLSVRSTEIPHGVKNPPHSETPLPESTNTLHTLQRPQRKKTARLSRRTRDLIQAAVLFLLALFLNSGAMALHTQSRIADKVIRLHVLANSDSAADQALKLRVRDAVSERAREMLSEVPDRETALQCLREGLPELRETAAFTAVQNGCTFPVAAELCEAEFPTKIYDGFALPAGKYLALRIIIGQGEGQNWWCVVFPPLCAAASGTVPETARQSGFSAEEIRLITGENTRCVVKFRIVELWEELRRSFSP